MGTTPASPMATLRELLPKAARLGAVGNEVGNRQEGARRQVKPGHMGSQKRPEASWVNMPIAFLQAFICYNTAKVTPGVCISTELDNNSKSIEAHRLQQQQERQQLMQRRSSLRQQLQTAKALQQETAAAVAPAVRSQAQQVC